MYCNYYEYSHGMSSHNIIFIDNPITEHDEFLNSTKSLCILFRLKKVFHADTKGYLTDSRDKALITIVLASST